MQEQQARNSDKPAKKSPTRTRLRGHPKDSPEVRISKSLSWLLRHGAEKAGLNIRRDGYVRVSDVLSNPTFKDVTFSHLREIVERDQKSRYHLSFEPQASDSSDDPKVWWIRANQGHSMKAWDIEVDLKPILSASDIPMAVHGTTRHAWKSIAIQGLSKMNRNHIHLAQNVPGTNVISGMRKSSEVLIFVNVHKALETGIKFYLSENGVVLTEGDENGLLSPELFACVENADGTPVGLGSRGSVPEAAVICVPADLQINETFGHDIKPVPRDGG